MLFGGCNCIPGMTRLPASGALVLRRRGFVTAMMAAHGRRRANRAGSAARPQVPEVDRLAVRMSPTTS